MIRNQAWIQKSTNKHGTCERLKVDIQVYIGLDQFFYYSLSTCVLGPTVIGQCLPKPWLKIKQVQEKNKEK